MLSKGKLLNWLLLMTSFYAVELSKTAEEIFVPLDHFCVEAR